MAEINIKRKSKNPVWPWILGILVVLAIVIWFIARNNKNPRTEQNQSGNIFTTEQPHLLVAKSKSITRVPGIVSLKLETYVA